MKAAYAEVAIQKLKADEEAAAALQARRDAEGALERGRVEGASQAEESYNKSFDEALPLIQDDVFTTAWGLAMDLLSVAPEDPRRKNVPLPSKQQAEEEAEEEVQGPGTEEAILQPPTTGGGAYDIITPTPSAAELIKIKQEVGAALEAATSAGTATATDSTVVTVE